MRSLLGIMVLVGITYLMSFNRKKIMWDQVIWGFFVQGVLALVILNQGLWGRLALILFLYLFFSYNVWRFQKEPSYSRNGWGIELLKIGGFALILCLLVFIQQKTGVISVIYTIFCVFLFVYLLLKCSSWEFIRNARWANILGVIFIILGSTLILANNITGSELINHISNGITQFLGSSRAGSAFIFGKLLDGGFVFAFSILAATVFFASFMAMMDYLEVTSVVVSAMARFMSWSMTIFRVRPISGMESLVTTANIFFSMQATPLMVRRYLPSMTKSEVSTIIVAGLATIAGGTMAIFINLGVPAAYLLSASVISAPAAICLSKILYPETEVPETLGKDMTISQPSEAKTLLGAASDGIIIGAKSGFMISVMVMGFISLMSMVDLFLGVIDMHVDGSWLPLIFGRDAIALEKGFQGIIPTSIAQIFGYIGMPFAWILGTPVADIFKVGELLGLKVAVNEAVAYSKLLEYMKLGLLSEKSILIASYALCGFANIGSLGILIGVMSGVVPERKNDFIQLGIRGLLTAAFASFMTAAFAAMLL